MILCFIRTHRRKSLAAAMCVGLLFWLRLWPIPADLLADRASPSTVVVDRHGVPLYEARSEDGTRGVKLTAGDLPPLLVAATVAAEDRRFWWHVGIDPVAVSRAALHNVTHGGVVEGASTISQQVAKLLLARRTPQRSRGLRGKIEEAILALRLEHRFSKREMLAMYLNLAAYGNQVAGAERASQAYFGRSASMVTPAQAAFLAGLPQRPSGFNPYRGRSSALARQRQVLRRMASAGALTPAGLQEAISERLSFTHAASPFVAPHFVEMALASAGGGRPARIETTIDRGLQADVSGIIGNRADLLRKHGAANVAVVVLDNASGEWLAWEGSGNYFDAEHGGTINGAVSPRQPGSALKPFTYALAFERGYTPASVLPDVPSNFPTAETGVLYTPRNYDGRYRGPLLARLALAGSENVPAVALASELGVPDLLRFLRRAGLTTFDRNASYYGLGITLGNAEVRLDELVGAYAAFARGGEWVSPVYVRGAPQERRLLVSPRTAFWITDVLSDPEAREYIFGRGGSLELPFPVAVKTGTSQAYHDNWTIGYSRHVTVGVWVGNFDRTPLRDSTGVTGAGPIFHSVMLAAERRFGRSEGDSSDEAVLAVPQAEQAVTPREICALSGMSANPWCPRRQREWLGAERDPLPCSWHHLSDRGLLTIWPPEYRQWAKKHGLLGPQGIPQPVSPASVVPGAAGNAPAWKAVQDVRQVRPPALAISSPPDGTTYLIDPTLRREFQSVALRAVTPAAGAVEWSVDGRDVGTASSDAQISWSLVPGRHVFKARDRHGRTAEATITVR
jgi:penicillin-binding protein 1C